MTKKERDNLVERLENFIPDAEARVEQYRNEDIKAGKRPRDTYASMVGVLEAKICHLIEDLRCN